MPGVLQPQNRSGLFVRIQNLARRSGAAWRLLHKDPSAGVHGHRPILDFKGRRGTVDRKCCKMIK
jgi:hypothetical protein